MLKRITREVSEDEFSRPVFDKENDVIEFIYDNKINVKMTFPKDYPFRPPRNLQINDKLINYQKLWRSSYIYKYFKIDCLCCKSITCTNNWNVSKKIKDVVEEYLDLTRIYTIAKVLEKLEKKNLPEEVVMLISEYINIKSI